MPAGLAKNYKEAAEGIQKYLENVQVTETTRDVGKNKQNVIEVVGTYKYFDLMDMDQYEWKLKFEFLDVEPKTEEDRKFRGEMAMLNPDNASLFTSKTSMFVYREVTKKIKTQEIIDGKVVKEYEDEKIEWIDFTKEFIQKMQRQDNFLSR